MIDVLVIGAGPIGLNSAIEAQTRGLDAVIIEKGCLANSIYQYPTHMKFFSTPDLLELGGIPFTCQDEKPTRLEALEYYRRVMEYFGLKVHFYETVYRIDGEDGAFEVVTTKKTHYAKKIIAAIGFFEKPRLMNVPGEELEKVTHYYKEPYPYVGQKVLIVGSGNSSAIIALECYRHGVDVTVAIRGDGFHEGVKYWIKPDILNRIHNGEIKAFFHTKVVRIDPHSVVLHHRDQGRIEIENDFVLAMTGYRPNYEFLEQIGIEISDDQYRSPVYNLQTYESNRKGIYLAGVVVGGMQTNKWFIENSREHSTIILNHILAERRIRP